MMERQNILATMSELKLFGMKAAYDEIIKVAVKRTHEPQQIVGDLLQAESKIAELRAFLDQLYNGSGRKEDLAQLSDTEVLEMAANLSSGATFATPVFDGASEEEIRLYVARLIQLAIIHYTDPMM